jgi:hypothetical protein
MGLLDEFLGKLDGKPAKIRIIEDDQGTKTDIYSGGRGAPDGPGCTKVVTRDGVNAEYLREGGVIKVDNSASRSDAYPNERDFKER